MSLAFTLWSTKVILPSLWLSNLRAMYFLACCRASFSTRHSQRYAGGPRPSIESSPAHDAVDRQVIAALPAKPHFVLAPTTLLCRLTEALELLDEVRGGAQQSDAEADAQRTMMEDLAFRLYACASGCTRHRVTAAAGTTLPCASPSCSSTRL